MDRTNYITDIVLAFYNVRLKDLKSNSRKPVYVRARHILLYLLRSYTTASLKELGRHINRDHTTVIYALNKTLNLTDTESIYVDQIAYFEQRIEEMGWAKCQFVYYDQDSFDERHKELEYQQELQKEIERRKSNKHKKAKQGLPLFG